MLYIALVLVCCLIQGESTCRRNVSGKVHSDPKDVSDRLKEVAKDKKLLAVVEASFLKFMGLKKRPKKHRKKTIKVPPHLWKIYRKWANRAYKDSVKKNSDTARVIHHSGMLVLLSINSCSRRCCNDHSCVTVKCTLTQSAFTCSKLTIETLEQVVKYVQS